MATEEIRGRLLEVAGEVFAERGFKGATVREIIRRADVHSAAVNYYFRDKMALYVEAVTSAFGTLPNQVLLDAWTDNTPAAEKLADFIRAEIDQMLGCQAHAWHRRIVMQELANPTTACAEVVAAHIRPRAQILGDILQTLVPDLDAARRQLIAHSIIGQVVFYRLAEPIVSLMVGEEEYRRYTAERLSEHIVAFSFAALGLAPPLGKPSKPHPASLSTGGPVA
jgi:AcrR family transcriptional regulator